MRNCRSEKWWVVGVVVSVSVAMAMARDMYVAPKDVEIWTKWTISASPCTGTRGRGTVGAVSTSIGRVRAFRGSFYLADPTATYGKGISRGKTRDDAGDEGGEARIRGTDVNG